MNDAMTSHGFQALAFVSKGLSSCNHFLSFSLFHLKSGSAVEPEFSRDLFSVSLPTVALHMAEAELAM